jgi:hypothetical protein
VGGTQGCIEKDNGDSAGGIIGVETGLQTWITLMMLITLIDFRIVRITDSVLGAARL